MAISVYLHVALKSFQRHLAYRAANLAGILTNLFFGAVYVFIYLALFKNRSEMGGLDARDAVTYATISQALLMVMSAFGSRELSEAIIKGDVAADLCRPLDTWLYWGAIDLGRAVYYLLFRGVPTYLLGMWIFHARMPSTAGTWPLFLGAVVCGVLLSFAFRFIVSSLAFWTTDVRGINYLVSTSIVFFSGFIIPLNFLPGALRRAVERLPFQAMAHLPITIYLGKAEGPALARTFGLELVWLAGLTILGRAILRHTLRRVAIHGG
jgi:ABC-2 type transport system permease protein